MEDVFIVTNMVGCGKSDSALVVTIVAVAVMVE
jgi:hypothetical protein